MTYLVSCKHDPDIQARLIHFNPITLLGCGTNKYIQLLELYLFHYDQFFFFFPWGLVEWLRCQWTRGRT